MRKIFIVLIILSLCSLASAQGFKLGIAGNATFPLGDFKDYAKSPGYGIDAFGVFDLMVLTVTARVGYLDFGEKDWMQDNVKLGTAKYKAVVGMAGLRWEFGLPVLPSFYAGLEGGIHAFTREYTMGAAEVPNPDESETKFSISPNVGVSFAGFDVSAYYMYIKDMSYWGVRLGWGIGI